MKRPDEATLPLSKPLCYNLPQIVGQPHIAQPHLKYLKAQPHQKYYSANHLWNGADGLGE